MIELMRAIPAWLLYGIGHVCSRTNNYVDCYALAWLYQKAMAASSDVQGGGGKFGPWHAMERY